METLDLLSHTLCRFACTDRRFGERLYEERYVCSAACENQCSRRTRLPDPHVADGRNLNASENSSIDYCTVLSGELELLLDGAFKNSTYPGPRPTSSRAQALRLAKQMCERKWGSDGNIFSTVTRYLSARLRGFIPPRAPKIRFKPYAPCSCGRSVARTLTDFPASVKPFVS